MQSDLPMNVVKLRKFYYQWYVGIINCTLDGFNDGLVYVPTISPTTILRWTNRPHLNGEVV